VYAQTAENSAGWGIFKMLQGASVGGHIMRERTADAGKVVDRMLDIIFRGIEKRRA
jgi:hypothetical protein